MAKKFFLLIICVVISQVLLPVGYGFWDQDLSIGGTVQTGQWLNTGSDGISVGVAVYKQ